MAAATARKVRAAEGTSRKGRWLSRVRIASQLGFFSLFLFLLLHTELPRLGEWGSAGQGLPYPTSIFLQADPLLGLATVLSTWNLFEGLLWGLAVLLLTLLLGRAFCGWICPLGTLQQATSWLGSRGRKPAARIGGNRYRPSARLKYYLLTGLLISALFTSMLVGFFDPISLTVRSLGLSILPAVDEAARSLLEAMQESGWLPLQQLANAGQIVRPLLLPQQTVHVEGAWLIGLLFLLLVAASFRLPRFWCRRLCPLGALLGACSRPAIFGLARDEQKCTRCNRCLLACHGGCEPQAGSPWRSAECHLCFNCEAACPEDVLHFRFLPQRATARTDLDLTRRAVLGSFAAGAMAVPLLRSSAGFAGHRGSGADPRLIRPPGALPEEELLARCIKCGECMKVCPTGGLQPTVLQAGLEGLWTPVLVPRLGYCEHACTLCGHVCPTGAIRRLSEEQKTGGEGGTPTRIGTAFYDLGRCLPWGMATPCIVCEEWCPASPKAIWLEEVTVLDREGKPVRLQRPHLDPRRCTGCGSCEYACPVKDLPAVRVSSAGETRHPHNRFLLGG